MVWTFRWFSFKNIAADGKATARPPHPERVQERCQKATNFLHPERVQQNDFLHPERVQQSTRSGYSLHPERVQQSDFLHPERVQKRPKKRNRCTRSG
ncbi:hypothetical protein HpMS107_56490 [Helicobacter pylori]